MTIYIDSDFKCRTSNDGTMTEVKTDFFNGKCQAFIEGYRFIPSGRKWTRADGTVFTGEMIAPWQPYDELDALQRSYEQLLIGDMERALHTLGVRLYE